MISKFHSISSPVSHSRAFSQRAKLAVSLLAVIAFFFSCSPEAPWETEGVEVSMKQKTVSAGFVEYEFSTNKDAYYLIAICEPWEDYNPVANSKQFMQLALDSAYAKYLIWRNDLLRNKEFNVAPFASHSLQYGKITHFFTGLIPDHDYWVYAFPVNPETMKPVGKLELEHLQTTETSTVEIRFDYRVKGVWDYIYPVDTFGNVNARFPYIAITEDSVTIAKDEVAEGNPYLYFMFWETQMFLHPELAMVYYGVKAIENNGDLSSNIEFEEGHTYYTSITGYDGLFKHMAIYKFTWHKGCEYYFQDTDSTNLFYQLAL